MKLTERKKNLNGGIYITYIGSTPVILLAVKLTNERKSEKVKVLLLFFHSEEYIYIFHFVVVVNFSLLLKNIYISS